MNDYTLIIEGIITVLVGVVTAFVIPYIKAKISAEDLSEIMRWVKIAVQAAEMIYTEAGKGKEKKAYVVEFLNSLGIKYDSAKIDNLIESAVLELKKEIEYYESD